MKTITLHVQGMSCNHCVQAVEKALGKLNGIETAKVDLAAKQVTISFDEKAVDQEKIKETIEDQGYDVV